MSAKQARRVPAEHYECLSGVYIHALISITFPVVSIHNYIEFLTFTFYSSFIMVLQTKELCVNTWNHKNQWLVQATLSGSLMRRQDGQRAPRIALEVKTKNVLRCYVCFWPLSSGTQCSRHTHVLQNYFLVGLVSLRTLKVKYTMAYPFCSSLQYKLQSKQ